MGVFQTVSNWLLGEYKVRTTQASDGAQLQHMRLDIGSGATESQVTEANPLPVTLGRSSLTASSPTFATVGATSAEAVASNANRKGLVLTNRSANTISFGIGATAVLNSGITLNANGGVWEMGEFTFSTAAINAIASSAGSALAIQELT